MARIVYVDGAYQPHERALVHYEDRGYQFSDGAYEVILVRRGRLVDDAPHLARLERSLGELKIERPLAAGAWRQVIRETIRRNRVREGLVYLQVTRGAAPRDHFFPKAVRPVSVCSASARVWPEPGAQAKGVSAITTPDERWARCDIKSVGLLANVLAKQAARDAGAAEAIFVAEDGVVREGGSSNLWIVDAEGKLRTHPIDNRILAGVTRATVKELAETAQIPVLEERFTLDALMGAREAFVTSATSFVKPVVEIDGKKIGTGEVGPVSQRLFELYVDYSVAA